MQKASNSVRGNSGQGTYPTGTLACFFHGLLEVCPNPVRAFEGITPNPITQLFKLALEFVCTIQLEPALDKSPFRTRHSLLEPNRCMCIR